MRIGILSDIHGNLPALEVVLADMHGRELDALFCLGDLVGYGGANFFEGSAAAPAASNTLSVLRQGNGAQDTDDNAADFVTGSPNPRNSGLTPPPTGRAGGRSTGARHRGRPAPRPPP